MNSAHDKIVALNKLLVDEAFDKLHIRVRLVTARLIQELIEAESTMINELKLDSSAVEEISRKNIEFLNKVDILAENFLKETQTTANLVFGD